MMKSGINSVNVGAMAIGAWSGALVLSIAFLVHLTFGTIVSNIGNDGMVKRDTFEMLWTSIDNNGGVASFCESYNLKQSQCDAAKRFYDLKTDQVALSRIDAISQSPSMMLLASALDEMKNINAVRAEYLTPFVSALADESSESRESGDALLSKELDELSVELNETIHDVIVSVSVSILVFVYLLIGIFGWSVATPSTYEKSANPNKKKLVQFALDNGKDITSSSASRAGQIYTGMMQLPIIRQCFAVGFILAFALTTMLPLGLILYIVGL